MEAPFRFPISGLADIERLLQILATSRSIVPGSLRLAEGRELLEEQLTAEGRLESLLPLITAGNFQELVRLLWQQPLGAQRPRYLRFNARLKADAELELSMRITMPTSGNWPRWIDLEGSRDPATLARLRKVYKAIGKKAQLNLLEV